MAIDRGQAAADLCREGVIRVIRESSLDLGRAALESALEVGATRIEIALTTPGALDLLREVKADCSQAELRIGTGSVLTMSHAQASVESGADFLVSPVFLSSMVRWTSSLGVLVVPGVFTPSEAVRARDAGFPLVKLFPAHVLGQDYLRSLLAPIPDLCVMVSGGVTEDSVPLWLAAGAKAVVITHRATALSDRSIVTYDGEGGTNVAL